MPNEVCQNALAAWAYSAPPYSVAAFRAQLRATGEGGPGSASRKGRAGGEVAGRKWIMQF